MWFSKKKEDSCTIISKNTIISGEIDCSNDNILFIEGTLITKDLKCNSVNVSGELKSLGDNCNIKLLEVSGKVIFNDIVTSIDTLILKDSGSLLNFKELTVNNLIVEGECIISGENLIYTTIQVAQKAKLNVRLIQASEEKQNNVTD